MYRLEELVTFDWGSVAEGLKDVLVDPASNLTAFILLLAIVAVAGLIAIIILMLALTRSSSSRRGSRAQVAQDGIRHAGTESSRAAQPLPTSERRQRLAWLPRWIQLTLLGAAVAVALLVGGVYSGSNAVCADACHGSSVSLEGNHKDIRCVECHEGRGVDSLVALPGRMAHLLTGLGVAVKEYPEPSSRACTSCHRTVTDDQGSPDASHLRMSHSEPIGVGLRCLECHRITHNQSDRLLPGVMQTCIRCHDGDRASADCGSCHVGDPSGAAWAQGDRRHYSKVQTREKYSCEGCHDQATCDACHGLRLPHSDAFIEGGHARDSAFDGKEVCWKCHTRDFCMNACHRELEPHGPNERWRVEHGRGVPFNAPCACHSAMYPKPPDVGFCPLCHDTRPRGSAPPTQ